MKRELDACQLTERSISKKYRKEIWNPFIAAVKRYELVEPGDKIAVCVSGGKDSMLLAKLMQMLQRYTETPFDLIFLTMDPGYAPENRKLIEENAAYADVVFDKYEEFERKDISDQYDYQATPAMFIDKELIYQAHLFEPYEECKAHVKEVMDKALAG